MINSLNSSLDSDAYPVSLVDSKSVGPGRSLDGGDPKNGPGCFRFSHVLSIYVLDLGVTGVGPAGK